MEQPAVIIYPCWPAPDNIVAACSSRIGGVSEAPYGSLNVADHVGDSVEAVIENRHILATTLALPSQPIWLQQSHSSDVIEISNKSSRGVADASYTVNSGVVCTVVTADCLPVLLCDRKGTAVAALHAGWRGLVKGIVENTVSAMPVASSDLMAWLGPAISQQYFEVGPEVRDQFTARFAGAARAFSASTKPGHYMADIYQLATMILNAVGVTDIYGAEFCSYDDPERFYSYRREGVTGRMATMIYRQS